MPVKKLSRFLTVLMLFSLLACENNISINFQIGSSGYEVYRDLPNDPLLLQPRLGCGSQNIIYYPELIKWNKNAIAGHFTNKQNRSISTFIFYNMSDQLEACTTDEEREIYNAELSLDSLIYSKTNNHDLSSKSFKHMIKY